MTLRFLTAGESHGLQLTAILEGMPAGLEIDRAALDDALARRQRGHGSGGRMRIERDVARITAGVQAGRTTGAPIAITIENRDYANWADRDIPPMTIPRPGHADLSATVKYGYSDLRLALERASARETAARVAVGALCAQLLGAFGIRVGSYVVAIGRVEADLGGEVGPGMGADIETDLGGSSTAAADAELGAGPGGAGTASSGADLEADPRGTSTPSETAPAADIEPGSRANANALYVRRFERAEASDVRCPDAGAGDRMRQAIDDAQRAKDTLGGVFEIVALGVPPGLGSHVHADRRLSGRILAAVGSIPAVKGVEVGRAFELAKARGTEVHDRLAVTDDRVVHETNRAGGIEGGISTGCPIVVRAAMKPISTTLTPLQSVDLATGAPATTTYERSDVCAVPRASVVGEAMLSFVLADALLEKLGGDSLDEMRPRFESLRQGRLPEFQLGDRPWRFDYDPET